MTQLLHDSTCRVPPRRPTRGRSTRGSTTSSRRASGGCSPTTRSSRRSSGSTARTTGWATRAATPSCGDRRGPRAPRGGRGPRPGGLSPEVRFERDLEIHNLRLSCSRRRGAPLGAAGDRRRRPGRRDLPPVRARRGPARRAARAHRRAPRGRPRLPRGSRTAVGPQVGIWQEVERATRGTCRACSARCARRPRGAPARRSSPGCAARSPRRTPPRRLRAGCATASSARPTTGRSAASATTSWCGSAPSATSTPTRSSDRRGAAAHDLEARRAAARELDPDADVQTVIERLKSDHPATFEEALDGYKDVMRRARAHLIDHDIATIPPTSRRGHRHARVPAQRDAVRGVLPAGPVRRRQASRCTSSRRRRRDPNAMREHYYASISNTSIHEAYPGHHLQLAVAIATRA